MILDICCFFLCLIKREKRDFIKIVVAEPPKNYCINKTDVYYTDDSWSIDLEDLNGNGPKKLLL